ncbi:MAG TPA: S41 family peptidase [Pedobacter sp.]|nr:S41 family peptidase [Pedobacter sp.]
MKYLLTIVCLVLSASLGKAQYLNEISVKLHTPADLRKDVYEVQRTLEKENPNLYLYITKKQLEYKFDSLRNTINEPLTSISLYVKLLSVISYIGDGHLTVKIEYAKLTAKDVLFLKTPITQHPIYQFEYRVIADRLFISKNLWADSTIAAGSEILSINGVPSAKIIDSLSHYITSDGFNTTFKHFLMNVGQFAERYRFLYPAKQPLNFELRSGSSTRQIVLNPYEKPGYDSSGVAPPPNTEYRLLTPDSNVAYLKIRSFVNGPNYIGYHGIFADIQKKKIKTLILDLRGNTGGETGWAASVYSHFIDTPTYFYKLPSELKQQKLLYGNPRIRDWINGVAKFQFPIVTPDTSIFKGKIYVLINGGSFSATSLLAANMRNLKNVVFVGEETGGSKNIWTAGIVKDKILPASKLMLSYGIVPAYFGDISDINGRGIMPDVPIVYTMEDYLAGKDLELEWVLKEL